MTQEEAQNLLRSGKAGLKEWNHWRKLGEPMPDLSGVDLAGVNMAGAILAGAQLSNADLHGADLSDADLEGAELIFARLTGAILRDAKLTRAHLIAADLSGANLQGAVLASSQLIKANMVGANCGQANFHAADMSQADLANADCTGADLSNAQLADANLTGTVLKSANLEHASLIGVKYDRRKLACRGIRAESCYGQAVFKRDVQDQDWIETFRAQSRRNHILYLIWKVFTDCGRSLRRVWLTASSLALLFGVLYAYNPSLLNMSKSVNSVWTPYYYSFVTFTTLGFGDVTPGSLTGEIVVTIEVIMGYITLGILVSILANKVARRS